MASGCAASPAASVAVDIMNKALPDHIHVLVVDGDSTSLKALESSLLAHNYKGMALPLGMPCFCI